MQKSFSNSLPKLLANFPDLLSVVAARVYLRVCIGVAILIPRISDFLPARAHGQFRGLFPRAARPAGVHIFRSIRVDRIHFLVAIGGLRRRQRTGPPPRPAPRRRRAWRYRPPPRTPIGPWRSPSTRRRQEPRSGPGRLRNQVSCFIFSPSISMPARSRSPSSTSCSAVAVV